MSRIDFVTGAPRAYMPLVSRLAAISGQAEQAFRRHAGVDVSHEPAEGQWSPARIAAHTISYARHTHQFIFRIVWMTDPMGQPWDEETEIAAERWLSLNAAGLVAALDAELSPTVELLSETPDASWGRPGLHPRHGRRSLRQQVERHIAHLEEHLEQLEQTLATLERQALIARSAR